VTYATYETSTFDGAPLELCEFRGGANDIWRYTNNVDPVVKDSNTFEPLAITRTGVEQTAGEAPKMVEITVPHDIEVASLFVNFLPPSPIGVTIYREHRTDPDAQFVVVFTGTIASSRYEDSRAILSCRPVLGSLNRNVPWLTYQRQCNWALYSVGCGALKDNYRIDTTVTAITGNRLFGANFSVNGTGWLNAGWVERKKTREVRFIHKHIDNELVLMSPFLDILEGEEVVAYAGCDRSTATCASKFNNLARYAGWPDVPEKNPFTQSVYGNGNGAPLDTELLKKMIKGFYA
jgi:uncharacterized phage protein (TIGR02218 family)